LSLNQKQRTTKRNTGKTALSHGWAIAQSNASRLRVEQGWYKKSKRYDCVL